MRALSDVDEPRGEEDSFLADRCSRRGASSLTKHRCSISIRRSIAFRPRGRDLICPGRDLIYNGIVSEAFKSTTMMSNIALTPIVAPVEYTSNALIGGAVPAVACSRATTSFRRVAEGAELHGGPHEKEMDAFGIQSVEQAVRLLGRQGHHNLLRLIH